MASHQNSTVTEEITNILGREILGGFFPPCATLLGEEEICARFGASRSAAREAAWSNAELLWYLRAEPSLSANFMRTLDGFTTVASKSLLVPVP